jgi:predicted lipid-binding transport protein (Tim44 family)
LATFLFAIFIGAAIVSHDAEARRLGGGKSFGRQSPNATRQAAPPTREAPPQSAQQPMPPVQPQPAGNRWLGPLAGIAAGIGIAALLSHFGLAGAFAEGLGSILVVALLIGGLVLIWRMLRGSRAPVPSGPRMEPVYGMPAPAPTSAYTPVTGAAMPGSVAALSSAPASGRPPGVPADFDIADFLRNAKVYFIRLQAAWDERNLADIREFTTPEVYAEIKMQIDEEKGAQNRTDVVSVDGELLGIDESPSDYLASVRFTGKISDNGASAAPFEEVWNFSKRKQGRSGWLLAGIQQIQ